MREDKNGYLRKMTFFPAFDKTDPDPSKNYGVSDVTLRFTLIKDNKAVELDLGTNWYLPHVFQRRMEYLQKEIILGEKQFLWETFSKEYPMEVCLYDCTHTHQEDDDWIEFDLGKPYITYLKEEFESYKITCYFWLPYKEKDVWEIFITKGEECLWQELEKIYREYLQEK